MPTEAGERLRGYAGRLLSEYEGARDDLKGLAGLDTGRLAIGADDTVGVYLLPKLAGEFRSVAPRVRLAIRISAPAEFLDALEWQELDLVMLEDEETPHSRKGIAFQPLAHDEVVLFVPSHHPLAARGEVSPSELLEHSLVSREEGSPTRGLVLARLADAGVPVTYLDNPLQLGNTEAIKRAVQAGLGFGFASRFAIEQEVSLGLFSIVKIHGVTMDRKLWIATRQSAHPKERLVRFTRFLFDTFNPGPHG